MVPTRAAPVFGAAPNTTLRASTALGFSVIESQVPPLATDAFQVQVTGDAVTVTVVEAPSAEIWVEGEESVYTQAAAAWVTVKVCPAAVIVPVRWRRVVFGADVKLSTPDPLAPVSPFKVSQAAFAVALQGQPAKVVNPTEPDVPPAGALALGETNE